MTIRIYAKCDDRFAAYLSDGRKIEADYPPNFLGGADFVAFEIDLETGQILNWKKPTEEDLEKFS